MSERVILTNVGDFPAKGRAIFDVKGMTVLVVKTEDVFFAVNNKCPHLGLPLSNGKIDGTTISCPFHGSQFDLCSGENLDWVRGVAGVKLPEWTRRLLAMGTKPSPLQTYPVVVEGGKIYIET